MQVSEVLSEEKAIEGGEVTIQGVFVMERDVGYFVQSKDDIADKTRAVMVDYPGLEKLLLSSVPAYGGSNYSYCNDSVITGRIKKSPQLEFTLAIAEIHNFVIYMYGESIVVIA